MTPELTNTSVPTNAHTSSFILFRTIITPSTPYPNPIRLAMHIRQMQQLPAKAHRYLNQQYLQRCLYFERTRDFTRIQGSMNGIMVRTHNTIFSSGSCQKATKANTAIYDTNDLLPPTGTNRYLTSHTLYPRCHILQNPSNPQLLHTHLPILSITSTPHKYDHTLAHLQITRNLNHRKTSEPIDITNNSTRVFQGEGLATGRSIWKAQKATKSMRNFGIGLVMDMGDFQKEWKLLQEVGGPARNVPQKRIQLRQLVGVSEGEGYRSRAFRQGCVEVHFLHFYLWVSTWSFLQQVRWLSTPKDISLSILILNSEPQCMRCFEFFIQSTGTQGSIQFDSHLILPIHQCRTNTVTESTHICFSNSLFRQFAFTNQQYRDRIPKQISESARNVNTQRNTPSKYECLRSPNSFQERARIAMVGMEFLKAYHWMSWESRVPNRVSLSQKACFWATGQQIISAYKLKNTRIDRWITTSYRLNGNFDIRRD